MLPLFSPPSSDDEGDHPQRELLTAGIAIMVALVIAMFFVLSKGDISPAPFFFIFVLLPVMVANRRRRMRYQAASAPAKRKREFDGEDMYTLMDRMVDELDEDEAAYLRRRLDDRDRHQEREDTKASIADLLDDREQNRREQS